MPLGFLQIPLRTEPNSPWPSSGPSSSESLLMRVCWAVFAVWGDFTGTVGPAVTAKNWTESNTSRVKNSLKLNLSKINPYTVNTHQSRKYWLKDLTKSNCFYMNKTYLSIMALFDRRVLTSSNSFTEK